MWTAGIQMKWVCDHRSESQFKQLRKSPEKRKDFGASTGLEPVASGLALVLYQPELWRPIHWRPANLLSSSTRERNETQNEMMWTAGIQMKWVCDHRSEPQLKPEKKDFGASTRFEPVASALALQCSTNLSYEDPYTLEAGQFIEFISPWKERNTEWNDVNCGNTNEMSIEILFFGLFRNCLNCDSLRWSHTHFICIPAVHIISFCVLFLSRVDEPNKLAGLQCMGLHSSGW